MFAKRVGRKVVEKLVSNGAKLYDVRDPVRYRDGTILNATNLAIRNIMSINKLDKKTKLIFYSDTANDIDLNMSVTYAAQFGFSDLYIFVPV